MTAPHELVDEPFFASLKGDWLPARHQAEGIVSGLHRSRQRGTGNVFVEHREYRPGDDIRKLDWRAYARTDRDVIRHHEQEGQLRAHLVLDCSNSMAFGVGGEQKSQYAAMLLATFAYALIARGDAVGCSLFDDKLRHSVPVSSRPSQLMEVFRALEAGTQAKGTTGLLEGLFQTAASLPARGVIVIASDLLDFTDQLLPTLTRLRSRGSDVVVLQTLTQAELELPFREPSRFLGLEGEAALMADPERARLQYREEINRFIQQSHTACSQAGALHELCRTDRRPEVSLSRLLRGQRSGRVR